VNEQIKHEILTKHKQETRMQSLGMIVGIGLSVFVAMGMIDLVKNVERMTINQEKVMSIQEHKVKDLDLVVKEYGIHQGTDQLKFKEIEAEIIIIKEIID